MIVLNIATSLNGNNGKAKRFSTSIMNFRIDIKVSEGMWKVIDKHVKNYEDSFSSYFRKLVMKDLKIDEYGKESKK